MMLGKVLTVKWLVRFDIYGHVARLAGCSYRRNEVLVHQSPAPFLQHKEHSAVPCFVGRIVTEGNESQGRLLVFSHDRNIRSRNVSVYRHMYSHLWHGVLHYAKVGYLQMQAVYFSEIGVPPYQITRCRNLKGYSANLTRVENLKSHIWILITYVCVHVCYILSRFSVSLDGVWITNRIYWNLAKHN
jgi:hypothetical protein